MHETPARAAAPNVPFVSQSAASVLGRGHHCGHQSVFTWSSSTGDAGGGGWGSILPRFELRVERGRGPMVGGAAGAVGAAGGLGALFAGLAGRRQPLPPQQLDEMVSVCQE